MLKEIINDSYGSFYELTSQLKLLTTQKESTNVHSMYAYHCSMVSLSDTYEGEPQGTSDNLNSHSGNTSSIQFVELWTRRR